jgi:hypothetical protein
VQTHLHNWRSELRQRHRDEKGKIVKAHDHLMDCPRGVMNSSSAITFIVFIL